MTAPLDLVGAGEIARRLGVTSPAVSNWQKRHASFPTPIWSNGKVSAWSWSEVASWARETGRMTT